MKLKKKLSKNSVEIFKRGTFLAYEQTFFAVCKETNFHLKAQTFHVPPLDTYEMKLKKISKNSVEIFKRGTFLPYAQTSFSVC